MSGAIEGELSIVQMNRAPPPLDDFVDWEILEVIFDIADLCGFIMIEQAREKTKVVVGFLGNMLIALK